MNTCDVLDRIWVLGQLFYTSQGDKPTHVLLDPRLRMQLMHDANRDYALAPNVLRVAMNTGQLTVFDLPVIEVYKPYPFAALAKIALETAL